MSSLPICRLRALFPAWTCCCALVLILSSLAIAQPPGGVRPESPISQDNPPAPKVVGSSTAAFTTSMEVLNDSVKLGAGDRVSFRVVEDRQNPTTLFVTDSGEMEVPLIGRVNATGKTCKQLAQEIKPLLEREYFVRATVIIGLDQVGGKSRGKVYVTGQVRQPGAYEIMPDEPLTLSKVILKAGSLADFANKKEVRITRMREAPLGPRDVPPGMQAPPPRKQQKKPGFFGKLVGKKEDFSNDSTETIIVDLVEILEKGHLERDPVLKPGDLIYVPERLINF
jgi:protein involved in polysaccharide export with SLBB domain